MHSLNYLDITKEQSRNKGIIMSILLQIANTLRQLMNATMLFKNLALRSLLKTLVIRALPINKLSKVIQILHNSFEINQGHIERLAAGFVCGKAGQFVVPYLQVAG